MDNICWYRTAVGLPSNIQPKFPRPEQSALRQTPSQIFSCLQKQKLQEFSEPMPMQSLIAAVIFVYFRSRSPAFYCSACPSPGLKAKGYDTGVPPEISSPYYSMLKCCCARLCTPNCSQSYAIGVQMCVNDAELHKVLLAINIVMNLSSSYIINSNLSCVVWV